MSLTMATVERVSPDAAHAAALIAKAEAELAQRYSPEHRHGLAVDALLAQQARFFVIMHDDEAAGCGGYVVFAPGLAEFAGSSGHTRIARSAFSWRSTCDPW